MRLENGRMLALVAGILGGMLVATGCEEKKAPPPPPPPPPPVAKLPDPVDINGVIAAVKPDGRVQFPQAQAPVDRTLAEAVTRLASHIAKGDSSALGAMLEPGAKAILEELVASGGWAAATKSIEQVRVVSLSSRTQEKASSAQVGLAIQSPGTAQLIAWEGTRSGDAWVFKNIWVQDDKKTRASEFDGVSIQTLALTKDEEEKPAEKPAKPAPGASGTSAPEAPSSRGGKPGSGRV